MLWLKLTIFYCDQRFICSVWYNLQVAADLLPSPTANLVFYGRAGNFCHKFRGVKLWILKNLNIRLCNRKYGQENKFKTSKVLDSNRMGDSLMINTACEDQVRDESGAIRPAES